MKHLSLSLFSMILALGLASSVALEADNADVAPIHSRALQGSSSGSGSGSASGSIPLGAMLIMGVLDALLALLGAFEILAGLFPFLAAFVPMFMMIFEALVLILLDLFGIEFRKRQLKSSKISKLNPDLVSGLESAIAAIEDMISDLMEAREDPAVGTALDEQICTLADTVGEFEAILGAKSGKRRALKAKSGKVAGLACPKSEKSGKTTNPFPVVTKSAKAKSAKAKSYYSGQVSGKAVTSEKWKKSKVVKGGKGSKGGSTKISKISTVKGKTRI